jgi:hypothetical protein
MGLYNPIDRWVPPKKDGDNPNFRRLSRMVDHLATRAERDTFGVLDYSVAQPGNLAGVTTVLYQTAIPANPLSRNGDSLSLRAAFTLNGAGAGTRLRFYFGAAGLFDGSTNLYDTGSLLISSANSAVFSLVLTRYEVNALIFDLQVNSTYSVIQGASSYGSSPQNTQTDLALSVLGDGTSANDARGFRWHVSYLPTIYTG